MEDQSLYGTRWRIRSDPTWSVNIDGPEDWRRAEALVRAKALLSGNRNMKSSEYVYSWWNHSRFLCTRSCAGGRP